jgi:hypothetical protein
MDWAASIGFGAAIAGAVGYAGVRVFAGYPKLDESFRVLTSRESGFLEAAALTMFPPGGALSPSGLDAGIPRYLDLYLARVTPRLRRLMRALFFLFEHATLFFAAPGRGGRRRFSNLAPEQRVAVLEAWQHSALFPRRLAFTSLRATLTMGYFADPAVLRALRLAPLAIETPVCEADLWFPRIGEPPENIERTRQHLTPPSDGTPLALDGPLHPMYREPT